MTEEDRDQTPADLSDQDLEEVAGGVGRTLGAERTPATPMPPETAPAEGAAFNPLDPRRP